MLSGNKLFQAEQGSNALKIKGGIDPIASKKKFDFGVATPDSTDEAKKITLKNTETTVSDKPIADNPVLVKINEMFRGDQFKAESSFNASVPEGLREDLVALNGNCTCMFEENIAGGLKNNDKYKARMNDDEVKLMATLKETRDGVPAVTEDTIMQKVIGEGVFKSYVKDEYNKDTGKKMDKKVTGCVARAEDSAPFAGNGKQIHENLRLDYCGSEYKEIAETGGDVYILRFTSDYCPDNSTYPYVDETQPWNEPPCTGQGFTGSEEALIPEYTYGRGQSINNGAIYKVDKDGNEYLAAVWNKVDKVFDIAE